MVSLHGTILTVKRDLPRNSTAVPRMKSWLQFMQFKETYFYILNVGSLLASYPGSLIIREPGYEARSLPTKNETMHGWPH